MQYFYPAHQPHHFDFTDASALPSLPFTIGLCPGIAPVDPDIDLQLYHHLHPNLKALRPTA